MGVVTPLPHADAARFLRIEPSNGEIHHVELYNENMLTSDLKRAQRVHILAAHDLGKVSSSASAGCAR
jgi:hypothetical protein